MKDKLSKIRQTAKYLVKYFTIPDNELFKALIKSESNYQNIVNDIIFITNDQSYYDLIKSCVDAHYNLYTKLSSPYPGKMHPVKFIKKLALEGLEKSKIASLYRDEVINIEQDHYFHDAN
jgi:hypothetical protein